MMNPERPHDLVWARRLGAVTLGIWLAAAGMAVLTLLLTFAVIRSDVQGAASATTNAVGASVADQIRRAVQAGVPFDRLVDMPAYLDQVAEAGAHVGHVSMLAPDGAARYAATTSQAPGPLWVVSDTPVVVDGQTVATVRVGLAAGGASDRLLSLFWGRVLATAAICAILLEIVRGVLLGAIIHPVIRVAQAAARAASGTISATATPGRPSGLELTFDRHVRDLREQRAVVGDTAVAARAGHFDPAIHRRIDAIEASLDRVVNLAPGDAGTTEATGLTALRNWWRGGGSVRLAMIAAIVILSAGEIVARPGGVLSLGGALVALALALAHYRMIATEFAVLESRGGAA